MHHVCFLLSRSQASIREAISQSINVFGSSKIWRLQVYLIVSVIGLTAFSIGQEKKETKEEESKNLRQHYSGKVGFYQPGDGLNNGLMLGIDGITEFTHYNFFLSGAIDLYPKQSIDIFQNPKPNINSQQIILLPLHVNFGYKIFDVQDADSRGYIGLGGGYYFYFYNLEYQTSGGIFVPGSTQTDSKNGGDLFATFFARVLLGKIFVEPRFYVASKSEENFAGSRYVINPSGFAITIGFQQ